MHNNIILRLVTYYVTVIVFVTGVFRVFPALGEYIARERARQGGRAPLELGGIAESVQATPVPEGPMQLLDPEKTVPILVSLVLAVLVALPVAWVYRWTRPRRRFNQGFAHTLLVVPIAITLVVFLVKGSLALAFSLAGIVAAVRFRTSLEEPMDAVYILIVIGIGLAAGVQLLAVAVMASMLFNVVALAVWRTDYGALPAVVNGWRIADGAPEPPRQAGSGSVAPAISSGVQEPGNRFNAKLSVHATQVEEAQAFVVPLLEQHAKHWQLAEITQQADGTSIIEFDLRIKKSTDVAAFIREVEQGRPYVSHVQLHKTKSSKHESQ